ncbi:MAG: ThiF family adenylyltransferase [Pirellulales bacterium]
MFDYTTIMPEIFDRYVKQMRYAPFGEAGQRRLASSRVLIVGCGALGSVAAESLVRAGVGRVRIVDRDFLELSNLQRQVLFDEDDLRDELPKSVAAARKLARINSTIEVEPLVADAQAGTIRELCAGVDCIVDATDNFETRFLLNDAAHTLGIPWIYGGCLGAEGQTLTIVPGRTVCLRCIMPDPPPAGATATCDTAGVLGAAAGTVALRQALEALKILSGNDDAIDPNWNVFDLWRNTSRTIRVDRARMSADCLCCVRGETPWLTGERGGRAAVLCGRNSVQLTPDGEPVEPAALRAIRASRRLERQCVSATLARR